MLIFFSFFFSHLRQNTKEPLKLIFPTVYISICRPLLTASLQEKYPSFRVRYDRSYLVFGIFMSIVFLGYHILNETGSNWSVLYCGGGTAENGGNLSIRSAGPCLCFSVTHSLSFEELIPVSSSFTMSF